MNELDDVNIRHFKLASGEELIAYVRGEEEHMIVVESPMELHISTRDQTQAFMFTKWMPLGKNEMCTINPMHIISHVECDNDIKERYVRMCINMNEEQHERLDIEDDRLYEEPTDDELDIVEAMFERAEKDKLH